MSKDANINKCSASSPLQEDSFVKRACAEDSFLESDSETTIINPDFLTRAGIHEGPLSLLKGPYALIVR